MTRGRRCCCNHCCRFCLESDQNESLTAMYGSMILHGIVSGSFTTAPLTCTDASTITNGEDFNDIEFSNGLFQCVVLGFSCIGEAIEALLKAIDPTDSLLWPFYDDDGWRVCQSQLGTLAVCEDTPVGSTSKTVLGGQCYLITTQNGRRLIGAYVTHTDNDPSLVTTGGGKTGTQQGVGIYVLRGEDSARVKCDGIEVEIPITPIAYSYSPPLEPGQPDPLTCQAEGEVSGGDENCIYDLPTSVTVKVFA
jgi:hypothetical protein